MGDYKRYKYLVDKTPDQWATETQDNYRQFRYRKRGLDRYNKFNNRPVASHDKSVEKGSNNVAAEGQFFDNRAPETEYQEMTRIKEIKNQEELDQLLWENYLKKNPRERMKEMARKNRMKHRHKLIRNDLLDWEEGEDGTEGDEDYDDTESDYSSDGEEEDEFVLEKDDYTNIKNKLLAYQEKRGKKKLDPVYEKQRLRRRNKRIKKFKEQSRWLADSAFQTYFGKPAFANYGMGNTDPCWGGSVYGNYMKSHNVNPHKYPNNPENVQVFQSAEIGEAKLQYIKEKYNRFDDHIPRKCKDEYMLSSEEVKNGLNRFKLEPDQRDEKSKKFRKNTRVEPDLVNCDVFASKVNSEVDPNEQQRMITQGSVQKDVIAQRFRDIRKKQKAARNQSAKHVAKWKPKPTKRLEPVTDEEYVETTEEEYEDETDETYEEDTDEDNDYAGRARNKRKGKSKSKSKRKSPKKQKKGRGKSSVNIRTKGKVEKKSVVVNLPAGKPGKSMLSKTTAPYTTTDNVPAAGISSDQQDKNKLINRIFGGVGDLLSNKVAQESNNPQAEEGGIDEMKLIEMGLLEQELAQEQVKPIMEEFQKNVATRFQKEVASNQPKKQQPSAGKSRKINQKKFKRQTKQMIRNMAIQVGRVGQVEMNNDFNQRRKNERDGRYAGNDLESYRSDQKRRMRKQKKKEMSKKQLEMEKQNNLEAHNKKLRMELQKEKLSKLVLREKNKIELEKKRERNIQAKQRAAQEAEEKAKARILKEEFERMGQNIAVMKTFNERALKEEVSDEEVQTVRDRAMFSARKAFREQEEEEREFKTLEQEQAKKMKDVKKKRTGMVVNDPKPKKIKRSNTKGSSKRKRSTSAKSSKSKKGRSKSKGKQGRSKSKGKVRRRKHQLVATNKYKQMDLDSVTISNGSDMYKSSMMVSISRNPANYGGANRFGRIQNGERDRHFARMGDDEGGPFENY